MNARGAAGERRAALYLMLRGYRILDRNFRSRFGEIDIIAKKRDTVVFVEVKARGKNALSRPCAAVDIHKQKKIIKTAQLYILYKQLDDCRMRFDVIEVSDSFCGINRLKNAFEG